MDPKEIVSEADDWLHPAGTCEQRNDILGFIKCRKLLDLLRTPKLLKKDPVPWN
jgi:hypothetical protein